MTTHRTGRRVGATAAGTPTLSGANVTINLFNPPAAEGLPLAALDSATEGADALDAWARDPHGRNFLAHALVQLARDGWLRPEAGEGFEPVRERDDVPEPQDPAAPPAVPVPPTTHATVRAAVSTALWTAAEYHTVAEWICCEPINPAHDLCAQGGAALQMLKALLVDDPEAWKPAPLLDEVMRLLPPTGSVAEAHRLSLSEALDLGTGAPWDAIHERVQELRRMADEAQQQEAPATLSGRVARAVAEDASALRMDLYDDLAAFARETGIPGLQHAQIRDRLAEFLFEGLLRRAVAVPAVEAQQQPDIETPRRRKLRHVQPCNCEHPDCPDCQRRATEPERRAYYEAHKDDPDEWGSPVPGPGRVADEEQGETGDGPRTVCVCGHTKGEHVTVSGQLLCDVCDPDSTSNLVCRGFEAL